MRFPPRGINPPVTFCTLLYDAILDVLNSPRDGSRQSLAGTPNRRLFLPLQPMVVLLDKPPDFVGHAQQFFPLLAIQGHGKASQSVYRQGALLADPQRHLAALCRPLQAFVFSAKAFNLSS